MSNTIPARLIKRYRDVSLILRGTDGVLTPTTVEIRIELTAQDEDDLLPPEDLEALDIAINMIRGTLVLSRDDPDRESLLDHLEEVIHPLIIEIGTLPGLAEHVQTHADRLIRGLSGGSISCRTVTLTSPWIEITHSVHE